MDIIGRINQHYPSLSRSQRFIANYILKHPEDACFASLKELTEAVGTTEVTIVNFTRKIGVNSFLGLKKELQDYIRMQLTPNDKMYRAIGGVDGKGGIFGDFAENERAALDYTFEHLDAQALHTAVDLLKNASQVYIVGYDSSMPVAEFLLMRLHYLGIQAACLSFADPSNLLLEVGKVTNDAVFVLISFPAHSPQMEKLAKTLANQRTHTLVITDQSVNAVSRYATVTLPCSTGDLLFYNSITAPISIANLLSSMLAVDNKEYVRSSRDRVLELKEQIYGSEEL